MSSHLEFESGAVNKILKLCISCFSVLSFVLTKIMDEYLFKQENQQQQ